MTRRRLTVRRIDPWSVLKFGAVANVVLLLIWLLVVGVVFYIVDRIGLVDQVCDVVLEVGFEACGVNAGNLFRAIALLGLLGVVILTAVLVFLSFLHNLIADLTGGLTFTVNDDSPVVQRQMGSAAGTTTGASGGGRPPPLGLDRPADRATGDRRDEPRREDARGGDPRRDETRRHEPHRDDTRDSGQRGGGQRGAGDRDRPRPGGEDGPGGKRRDGGGSLFGGH